MNRQDRYPPSVDRGEYITAREYMNKKDVGAYTYTIGKYLTNLCKEHGIDIIKYDGRNFYHKSVLDI